MPDFRKSRSNQKGTKQAHTIKFTLLLTSNFLQNLSILRFFHFLTCIQRIAEMNIVNVFKFYIIFFHEIFLNFLPSFIVQYQRDFCAIEAHVPTQQKNDFFYDQLFSIAKFQVKRAKLISFYQVTYGCHAQDSKVGKKYIF